MVPPGPDAPAPASDAPVAALQEAPAAPSETKDLKKETESRTATASKDVPKALDRARGVEAGANEAGEKIDEQTKDVKVKSAKARAEGEASVREEAKDKDKTEDGKDKSKEKKETPNEKFDRVKGEQTNGLRRSMRFDYHRHVVLNGATEVENQKGCYSFTVEVCDINTKVTARVEKSRDRFKEHGGLRYAAQRDQVFRVNLGQKIKCRIVRLNAYP